MKRGNKTQEFSSDALGCHFAGFVIVDTLLAGKKVMMYVIAMTPTIFENELGDLEVMRTKDWLKHFYNCMRAD